MPFLPTRHALRATGIQQTPHAEHLRLVISRAMGGCRWCRLPLQVRGTCCRRNECPPRRRRQMTPRSAAPQRHCRRPLDGEARLRGHKGQSKAHLRRVPPTSDVPSRPLRDMEPGHVTKFVFQCPWFAVANNMQSKSKFAKKPMSLSTITLLWCYNCCGCCCRVGHASGY